MSEYAAAAERSLPPSAWALGAICLLAQVLALADRGLDQSDTAWVFLSMVLSALLIGWVSAGVLRARRGRVVLVWILFVLDLALNIANVIGPIYPEAMHGFYAFASLATAVGQLVALAVFCRSSYFAHERAHPSPRGQPSIAGLVLIAVTVGLLGGMTAPADGKDLPLQLHVGL